MRARELWERMITGKAPVTEPRAHKYNARGVLIDGHYFASTAEGERYKELKLMVAAGEIRDLRLQTQFALLVGDTEIGHYRADFTYMQDGQFVVEDVKGVQTAVYKWKKKHFETQYGIRIHEV